jgi:hypothetical protein
MKPSIMITLVSFGNSEMKLSIEVQYFIHPPAQWRVSYLCFQECHASSIVNGGFHIPVSKNATPAWGCSQWRVSYRYFQECHVSLGDE